MAKKALIVASVAALMLATVTYFLFNQTDDSIAVEAGSEKVLTDPQHPVQVEHTEAGFSFIDPETGEPLEEMSSTGSDRGEWVAIAHTSADVPVMLNVRHGLSEQMDTGQWLRDAKVQANTPTTVMFVMHHPNSCDKKFIYYKLWKNGNRVLVSESPVHFDSGLTPGTRYGYRVTESNNHPDEGFLEAQKISTHRYT